MTVMFWLLLLIFLKDASTTTAFWMIPPSSLQTITTTRRRFVLRAVVEPTETTTTAPLAPAISIEGLSCTHNGGETWQLKDVSYILPRGAKVALIGRNGTGKSSFLKILAECCRDTDSNTAEYDDTNYRYTGNVLRSKDVRVSIVEQEPPMPSDVTVADAILGIRNAKTASSSSSSSSSTNVFDIVRRYRHAAKNADMDPDEFTAASAAMDARDGGWAVLTKADEIATKLRVYHLQDQLLSKLSGGERKRVALCAALIEEPDVLLLDEPTNFLSLAGVQWLSELLQTDKKLTILMVTHDRAFLEEVGDRILELDNGSVYEHEGSYTSFLEAKEERLALQDQALQATKGKYKQELEWMRRQPQARQSKSKARIDAFYKLEKATKPRPLDANLMLDASEQRRIGGKIVSVR
jgi:ATP-binding cassette subfamily F protein uup